MQASIKYIYLIGMGLLLKMLQQDEFKAKPGAIICGRVSAPPELWAVVGAAGYELSYKCIGDCSGCGLLGTNGCTVTLTAVQADAHIVAPASGGASASD